MRVWVYPEKTWEELGAVRWEVEWEIVKPKALARMKALEARGETDDYDMDADIAFRYGTYDSEAKALKAARAVVNFGKTAFGCARVTKQVVDWYVEEDRVAEWACVGEPIYVP